MDLAAFTDLLWKFQVVNYSNFSAATVVTFDAILCLATEEEFIWRKRWSLIKVLYLFCRYYGVFIVWVNFYTISSIQHNLLTCKVLFVILIAGGGILLTFALNVIALVRLYALYNQSKLFLIGMPVLFLGDFSATMYFAIRLSQRVLRMAYLPPPGIPLPGCLSGTNVLYTTMLMVLPLVFSSILFLLMLYKYLQTLRNLRRAGSVACGPGLSLNPTLNAFYSSGIIWYFCFTAAIIFAFSFYRTTNAPLNNIGTPWLSVVQSISGSRLVLDLRMSEHVDPVSDTPSRSHSSRGPPRTLVFARFADTMASSFGILSRRTLP